jgi:hypothetical protein
MIAHGVSRGFRREREPAPEGRKIPGVPGSVAPLGLGIHNPRQPTAYAVGYHLSALRAWGGHGVVRGVGRVGRTVLRA